MILKIWNLAIFSHRLIKEPHLYIFSQYFFVEKYLNAVVSTESERRFETNINNQIIVVPLKNGNNISVQIDIEESMEI